jgi:hypothetical protein
MRNYRFIKILFLATFLFLSSFSLSFASATDSIDVKLKVGSCNNNGICELANYEDIFGFPADCTPIIVPPSPSKGPRGSSVDYFKDLTVEVTYNSAIIRWKSTIATRSYVKWGVNPNYKDGVLVDINFQFNHKVEITNLQAGTFYYFNIQSENLLGKTNGLDNQVFQTLYLSDITPPSNLTDIVARSGLSGITISWKNPQDEDLDYVRVMKNTDHYHSSPFIGHLAYKGNGEYFTDSDVRVGNKYFYSLFSRDKTGNYSSGSLVDVIYNPKGEDMSSNLAQVGKIEPLSNKYIVSQGESNFDFKIANIISLKGDEPVKVKTDYSSESNNDDMWVEIIDKSNNINKYFFSRIKDKDGFMTADIPPFNIGGYYSVNIYRYEK